MEQKIKVTSPEKILFPKDKIKKIDVLNYYLDVSSYMLPFVESRLLSVIRCHDNIKGDCFFKKHIGNDKNTHSYMDKDEEYFYITSPQELIYQAQMGTIEFHIWGSNIQKIENPNIMVFDLDPDEKLSLVKLKDAVLKVKSVLDELQLKSFIKTSGGKGYHIVIPFKNSKNWDSFYDFSKRIALIAESKWPQIFTTNIKKIERKGKVFIDYLRNNRGSTCIAPFSLRAREGATISMPISWEELIKPNEVTIKNYKGFNLNAWKDFYKVEQKMK